MCHSWQSGRGPGVGEGEEGGGREGGREEGGKEEGEGEGKE